MAIALSNTLDTALYRSFIVALDAAPGATYWGVIKSLVEKDGLGPASITGLITATEQFQSVYPTGSDGAFASALVARVLGSAPVSAEARTVALGAAEQILSDARGAGQDEASARATLISALADYLGAIKTDPAQAGYDPNQPYLAVARQLANKVAVADYYSTALKRDVTDIGVLREALARVSDKSAVVTASGAANVPVIETLIRGFDEATQQQLYRAFVVALDAAPGATYWGLLKDLVEKDGLGPASITGLITATEQFQSAEQFQSVYPTGSDGAFASALVARVLGSAPVSAEARTVALGAAEQILSDARGAGQDEASAHATLISALADYLGAIKTDPAQAGYDPNQPYLAVARQLANKVAVAEYITGTLKLEETSITALQTALEVTLNDAPVVTLTARNPGLVESSVAGQATAPVRLFSAASVSAVEAGQTITQLSLTVRGVVDGVDEKLVLDGTAISLALPADGWMSDKTMGNALSYTVSASAGVTTVTLGKAAGISASAAQALLEAASYQHAKVVNPTGGARVITLTQVKDSGGTVGGGSDTAVLGLSSTVTVKTNEVGRIQDGYIRGATVFADADGDGVLDPGEVSTTSDAQGRFSLSAALGNLVAKGGTDISTNLPHTTVLKAPAGAAIVNPLTTLVSAVAEQLASKSGGPGQGASAVSAAQVREAEQQVAQKLGLPAAMSLTTLDPLVVAGSATAAATEKAAAVSVYKASALVANVLTQTAAAVSSASGSGGSGGTAADAQAAAGKAAAAVAQLITSAAATVDLSNAQTLKTVLTESAKGTAAQAKVAAVADQLTAVMAATNAEVAKVVVTGTDVGAALQGIVKAQVVAQGAAATALAQAVTSGQASALTTSFTGAALTSQVSAAATGTIAEGIVTPPVVQPPTNLPKPLSASDLSTEEIYTEDTPLNLKDIIVMGADSANITATLRLSNTSVGSLSVATVGTVTSSFNGSNGLWNASGNLASINALLADLIFTPSANANGNFSIATSISDGMSPPITGSKMFIGIPLNDPPVVANPIANQSTTSGTALSFTIPSNAFTDVDNTSLIYSATLDSGTALPSWLSFNAATRTFTGTPTSTSGSPFNIRVTASDGSASVSDVFSLVLTSGANAAPVAANGSATTTEDTAVSGDLPAATDANGDAITYARVWGSGPSNGTVTIATNGTYTYAPNANFNGSDVFGFSVTDGKGGTNRYTQSITVTPAEDAPTLDPNYTPAPGLSIALNAPAPSGATGVLVSSLLGGVTDPDAGALQGMAIVGTNTAVGGTNGTLFYSLDNGSSWTSFGSATSSAGVVSPTQALLLPATARLYFQPASGSTAATLSDLLSFRAWDQTSGATGTKVNTATNGSTAAFSTATDTVALTLTAVTGTAPVLQTNPLDNVSNLDPRSNIVLSYDVPISAVAGKFIKIVNEGGSGGSFTTTPGDGFRGENAPNTLMIAANDSNQVTIAGNRVIINPTADLDLANKYHVEIDAGAWISTTGTPTAAFDGSSVLNFSTVTPGRFDPSLAVLSKKQNDQGTIVDSFKWLDIENIGSPSSTSGIALDLSGGSFALIFKDYGTRAASAITGFDGIEVKDFNVSANGFGVDDLLYADAQNDQPNDLLRTSIITKGEGISTLQFAPDTTSGSLGGFVSVTLVGGASQPAFDSIANWQSDLGASSAPFISG